MTAALALLAGVALAAFVVGVASYLRMMRTIPPEVARLHMARLKVRSNMLCFAAPELFVDAGATWRRRYVLAIATFFAAIASGALLQALTRA